MLRFETNGSINLNSKNTYFIITVYDGFGTTIAESRTAEITKNTPENESIIMPGNNTDIGIQITDFTAYENDFYSIKPIFEIKIANILKGGVGIFKIKIEHVNDGGRYVYETGNLILNTGSKPSIKGIEFNVPSGTISSKYVSGLKYITGGKFGLRINDIDDLNNICPVEEKVKLQSILFAEPYVFNNDITSDLSNYSQSLCIEDVTFSREFNFAPELINVDTAVNISGGIFNGMGETPFVLSTNILLATIDQSKESSMLEELFYDEQYRYFQFDGKLTKFVSEYSIINENGENRINGYTWIWFTISIWYI